MCASNKKRKATFVANDLGIQNTLPATATGVITPYSAFVNRLSITAREQLLSEGVLCSQIQN